MNQFDIIVVGAGPAGATCAALCAAAGKRVALLERAIFPRDKVCGDCLNPACWPVLDRLGVSDRVAALPQARLEAVEFIGTDGRTLRFPLNPNARGEIAVKRRHLDDLLLDRARELGAHVETGAAVTRVAPGWRVAVGERIFEAPQLVAADGRNSTVARLLGLLPPSRKDRLGLQTHLPQPADFGNKVAMHFLPRGYCGVAAIGENLLNVCLVARPAHLEELKAWTRARFTLEEEPEWRTIAPLSRKAIAPRRGDLLLAGDAARVVEPFTGEGIYYALASGALAAEHLIRGRLADYPAAHAALYRGRLWINQLARLAVLHPFATTRVLALTQRCPGLLRLLTSRVIGSSHLAPGG
ncbi:MAG TPA: FAD-dependent monooxygenase [Chthoniobacteraceae bacterium]